MPAQYIGQYNGFAIYRDAEGCFYYGNNEYGGYDFPIACSVVNQSGGGNLPTVISTPNAQAGGAPIQSGHSWYEDLLNTFITLGAIGQGATHIPTTAQGGSGLTPYPQRNLSGLTFQEQQALLALQNNKDTAGGKFGDSLQKMLTDNFTLIALGVGVFILYKSGRK